MFNNNGESWESYTGTETQEHNFSSTGTTLKVKISGNGHDYKLKYITCNDNWDRLEVPTTIHTLNHIEYIYMITTDFYPMNNSIY